MKPLIYALKPIFKQTTCELVPTEKQFVLEYVSQWRNVYHSSKPSELLHPQIKEVKTWVSVWIGRKGTERAESTKQQEKISTELES